MVSQYPLFLATPDMLVFIFLKYPVSLQFKAAATRKRSPERPDERNDRGRYAQRAQVNFSDTIKLASLLFCIDNFCPVVNAIIISAFHQWHMWPSSWRGGEERRAEPSNFLKLKVLKLLCVFYIPH